MLGIGLILFYPILDTIQQKNSIFVL